MNNESVWDYPRPPIWEKVAGRIKVVFGDQVIVDTNAALRVLETSHPPVYYLPPEDIATDALTATDRKSICEWKGVAHYFHVQANGLFAEFAAWGYPQPTPEFGAITNHVAFYAHLMDGCYVNGQRVQAQSGGFYGGWITPDIDGPFKGVPGSKGW